MFFRFVLKGVLGFKGLRFGALGFLGFGTWALGKLIRLRTPGSSQALSPKS